MGALKIQWAQTATFLCPPMPTSTYTAAIRQDGDWQIGWIEEIPGVNSQGNTRDELMANLREALDEALELNQEEARAAAGASFEEVSIQS